MAKKSLILVLLILTSFAFGSTEQKDPYSKDNMLNFVNYLYELNEFKRCVSEGLRTALIHPESGKEIYPQVVKSYFKLKQYKSVVELIDKNQLGFKDSLAYGLFKSKNYSRLSSMTAETDFQLEMILAGHLILDNMEGFRNSLMFIEGSTATRNQKALMKLFQKRLQFKTKSPLTAGLLSTLVPGLGRIYAGRLADGLFSMIYISLMAYKVYYSFDKQGINSIEPWLWAAMDLYFYVGNIYGSVVAAKIRTRDFLRTMENEIQLSISINF
ncbi:hypothetical protein KAJ26_00670 [bacterium]|nr:hypothetical protein [bacterium]